jgi:hypothetical protein
MSKTKKNTDLAKIKVRTREERCEYFVIRDPIKY